MRDSSQALSQNKPIASDYICRIAESEQKLSTNRTISFTERSIGFFNIFGCAGRSSAVLGVSQAVQDTARLHQAAKLAAAVALPPPPAVSAPGMVGNVGRASVADLFTATPPVFGPTSDGNLMHWSCIHQSVHPSIQPSIHPFIVLESLSASHAEEP